MKVKYLIESKECEHEILGRFHEFIDNISNFLVSLNISPLYSWYLIEIQMNKLIPSFKGDVDILAGRLEPADPKNFEILLDKINKEYPEVHPTRNFRLAAVTSVLNGGLKWIPSLDYLIGIEVKCCYLPSTATKIEEDEIKSTKSSSQAIRHINQQIERLQKMGFNKVGLFEFIANPPADGVGSQPWFRASGIAGSSLRAMENIFGKRCPENSSVGHGACSISGIAGRVESGSGASSDIIFQQAEENPYILNNEIKANRQEMEENLARIFEAFPCPQVIPAIFVYDRSTHKISLSNKGILRF